MMQDLRLSTERQIDDELIGVLQLGNELHKPLRALSGGTRQKVSAVIAFLFSPEILVLDEPTAGLDPLASSQLKDRIQHAAGNGTTVLFTSHVMSEMEEMSDTVVFLLDGRVQFAESPDATRTRTGQPNLERAVAHVLSAAAGEKVAS
jgi:Cu-processing system ATP-binding protein